MIIVTKPGITEEELDHIRERIEQLGMRTHISRGEQRTVIGCIGERSGAARGLAASIRVESVTPCSTIQACAREFVANAHGRPGRRHWRRDSGWARARGDCGFRARWRGRDAARHGVRRACRRRALLRGGAVQAAHVALRVPGVGAGRASHALEVRAETGLQWSPKHGPSPGGDGCEHADVLQIGARNMQNFPLFGSWRVQRPGCSARAVRHAEGVIMAAEYIMAEGNRDSFCASEAFAPMKRRRATPST